MLLDGNGAVLGDLCQDFLQSGIIRCRDFNLRPTAVCPQLTDGNIINGKVSAQYGNLIQNLWQQQAVDNVTL